MACSLVNLRDPALCSTASRVCTVLTLYRTYILVSRGSTCIKQGCKVLHLPLNKKEEQKVFCLGFLAPICKFPQSQFLCPFFLFSSETLPAAVGGTTLSPGAVTVLQDTRGETDSVLTSSNRPVVCVADLLQSHQRCILKLTGLAGLSIAGCGQLSSVCARRLRKSESLDDRLWKNGPLADTSNSRPQDSLGGGQQGGRLPVGTGQPHRHLQHHAPGDSLSETQDCSKRLMGC